MSSEILEREGLARLGDETLRDLSKQPPEAAEARRLTVRMTSGTTGRAPVVIANEHFAGDSRGFGRSRALMIAIGGNNTRLANALLVAEQAREPIRIMALDDADLAGGFETLVREFAPDAIRGFTSFVRRAAAFLGEARRGVSLLKLSGEKWTRAIDGEFRSLFPEAQIDVLYITNEIGVIATRDCAALAFGHYHAAPGVLIEIDGADESGLGELLASKRFFRSFSVSRYRVGDLARIDPGACTCGEASFELVGRKGSDYIKLVGAILLREEFDRVAQLCGDLFDDYRAEAWQERGIGHVALTVYAPRSTPDIDIIRERFSRALFLTPTRTLEGLCAQGIFAPLEVSVSEQPFPAKNKEVKLTERRA